MNSSKDSDDTKWFTTYSVVVSNETNQVGAANDITFMVLQDHMTNLNLYISTTTATKFHKT